MKKFWQKHKTLSILIILAVVGGCYYSFKKITTPPVVTHYTMGAVTRDTLISTVTESGQMAASNEIDIKPKVSADVTLVLVTAGQSVKAGQLLFTLDATDALKAVRDAKSALDSSNLALTKLKRGDTPEQIQTNELQVQTAQKNITTYQNNLADVKNKAANDLANIYNNSGNVLQDVYDKTDNVLNQQISPLFNNANSANPTLTFQTLDTSSQDAAQQQRVAAGSALATFKSTLANMTSDDSSIDNALSVANTQLNIIQNFLQSLSDATNAAITSANFTPANLSAYQSAVSGGLSTITSNINTITNQIQAIASQNINNQNEISGAETQFSDSETALTQAQNSLALAQAGADPLDIQSAEIDVQTKQNALNDAEENYSYYSIRAPFDGIVSTVDVIVGDPASSGSALATLITPQQVAVVTANEVDTAQIKIGDKATLTFDALPDLSVTGVVQEIDTVGTVSQGVVSYNIKITLDIQSDEVKPGMTVSANIITDIKPNVLVVPNSALKSQGSNYYVLMIDNPVQPAAGESGVTTATSTREQFVQTGEANDTETEITSGLNIGDQVVVKTLTANAAAVSTATTGAGAAGGGFGGGAAGAGGLLRTLGR